MVYHSIGYVENVVIIYRVCSECLFRSGKDLLSGVLKWLCLLLTLCVCIYTNLEM